MNRCVSETKFFNTCVYGLVSMLEYLVFKKYGFVDRNIKYLLWSSEEDSLDFKGTAIHLQYRDMYMKFGVVGSELIPADIEGFDYEDIKRITAVVEDCVGNLSNFKKPISRVEGVLNHSIREVRITKSKYEIDSYDVVLF